jgi:predicted nucleotidyltransferase
MKYGLKDEVIEQMQAVFQRYPVVERVILYGSRAMGNYRYNSDIDLTLVGQDLDLTTQFRIDEELDDLLLPYKIDLSIFHQIDNPDLLKHIDRNGVILYECI